VSAPSSIAVVGAGAWGTALALAAARAGRDVVLLGRDAAAMAEMASGRENARYLPGITLPPTITLTADPAAVAACRTVLVVVPAQSVATVLAALPLASNAVVVLCAKGIDRASGRFLSEVAADAAPSASIGLLSGPSFASDVARGLPTAVTLAHPDEAVGMRLAEALGSTTFRPYWSPDLRGVELGGALKNVLAIAAGIVVGRCLGESARAALIARGFAEMTRLGTALGARPETFGGLSGLGDLVLTATSEQSRNLRFGLALGRGEEADLARTRIGTVEGVATASAAAELAESCGIDAPITAEVSRVVTGRDSIDVAIDRLMRRPLKAEVRQ
jgi:glycerol-3-phosphate dehydrogenase (NAD(P)+)